jgi:hypothetical protein
MTTRELTPERREQLAGFYRARHRTLERAVTRRSRIIDDALVAEACAIAWFKLARRPDVGLNRGGLVWLMVIATREARRLDRGGPEKPVGTLPANPSTPTNWPSPPDWPRTR